ncbi:hypothetical protein [Leisingera caerulea]|uniref:hypothetical protein n=1 Tax=Leisingera caerulea TaxID=506591 RepID=UPI0003F81E91|nr:hypothetical protein [Leisingera caerulea]
MKKLLSFGAVSLIALTACSTGEDEKISRYETGVKMGLERLGGRTAKRAGGSQFSDGIFVGASPERHNASALLPSHLEAPGAIKLQSRDPMGLNEIIQRMADITGIPHILALGPTGKLSSANDNSVISADEATSSTDSTGRPAPRNAVAGGRSSRASEEPGITMRPDLRGSLSDVLNRIASTFEVEWSYSDGRVIFRDYVTRKYQITALPSTSGQTSSIGSNNITSTSSINSDVWSEVQAAMSGLVGEGAQVSIGSTTGLVTVTAKVADQNRVQEYIEQLNGTISQQISFDVQVMTVSLNDENKFGLDLGAAISNTTDGAVKFGSSVFSGGALGDYNIGILSGDVSVGAVVNALSTQGRVSVKNRAGATTSNNRAAPIEVVTETPYLKEITIEEDEDGDDRIIRTPDIVTTGFQMQLFPRIMNNRDIMVQYTVRLSELNDMRTFGEGNDAIQQPVVSKTSFEQQTVVENGQTLILAGFERERITTEKKKNANGLSAWGGHSEKTNERVATVMMITPRIIDRSKAAH